MYFEFDDVRRIHQPYTDSFQRGTVLINLNIFRTRVEGPCLQQPIHELEERNVRLVNRSLLGRAILLKIYIDGAH
jgi:hypothetical protein